MATQTTKKQTALIKGLITEGNEITDLDDSTLDESNFELLRDGTRRRRRPIVEELSNRSNYRAYVRQGALPHDIDRFTSSYIWRSPAGEERWSVLVEEIAGVIKFYLLSNKESEDGTGKLYLTKRPYYDEVMLAIWGQGIFITHVDVEDRQPSTFTEGGGSLYIFNKVSGTIKVSFNGAVTNRTEGSLQFTPIGTWVRDYTGAATEGDPRERQAASAKPAGTLYGQPIVDNVPGNLYSLVDELPLSTKYNLSNQGWSAKDVHAFRDQSFIAPININIFGNNTRLSEGSPRSWPAEYDRHADGRKIAPPTADLAGLETSTGDSFLALNIINAQDRSGEPPKGNRIGHSALHPAGALTSTPFEAKLGTKEVLTCSITALGDLQFTLTSFLASSSNNSWPSANLAAFAHALTFQLTLPDGNGGTKNYVGGLSGVISGIGAFTTSSVLSFFVAMPANLKAAILATPQIPVNPIADPKLLSWFYKSEPNFPHALLGDKNGFNYRRHRRPAGGAFYANRLWQTGDVHDRVYYSQMLQSNNNQGGTASFNRESMCHTANSPTDPDDSAVVATDGGYLYLPNSGTHYGATVLGDHLYVMTDTGIYRIGAGGAGFFLPEDFEVVQVSSRAVLGPKAWANTGKVLYVATDTSIIRFGGDPAEGTPSVSNPIRKLYQELVDATQDVECMLVYEEAEQQLRLCVSPAFDVTLSTEVNRINLINQHSTMLTYNERMESWYRYDTSNAGVVRSLLALPQAMQTETANNFRYLVGSLADAGTDTGVLLSWGVELDWNSLGTDSWVEGSPTGYTDFRDTGDAGQNTPRAFLLSNHYLLGEGHLFSNIHYVTSYSRNVATHYIDNGNVYVENRVGSLFLSAQWDWSDKDSFGKFTSPQQVHKFRRSFITAANTANPEIDRGEALLVHKMKVRGRGREFRLLWEAQDDFDAHLVGFSFVGLVMETI